MIKTEFFNKMQRPNVLVHITSDLNHNGYFYPRIPENRLIGGKEDTQTKRVCCAQDIDGCLTSLSISNIGIFKVFLIDIDKYEIRNNVIFSKELYENNLVEDAYITGECWITKEINVLEEDSYIIAIKVVINRIATFLLYFYISMIYYT